MEPLKWHKHLKLVEYGLRDYNDLIDEIHRYSVNEVQKLYCDISEELNVDRKNNNNAFYIVKLVENSQYYKLPNYRIYSIDDLYYFFDDFQSKKSKYNELWYCRTPYDNNSKTISLAGRIAFKKEVFGNSQTIEQVWNVSPRFIEEFNLQSEFIYLRADRISWGHRYTIDQVYIPNLLNVDEGTIRSHFISAVVEIEREREKIEIFEDYLSSFDYEIFSLEYKVLNGRLTIIDWDTPNDLLVLKNHNLEN